MLRNQQGYSPFFLMLKSLVYVRYNEIKKYCWWF